ncbi:MAG: ankyrin repeat domain-containing protein [Gammaproteobacteria bacterium]|nr:ankyrin repeat domain-containing protein [Gammaproteobacteria bacterium]
MNVGVHRLQVHRLLSAEWWAQGWLAWCVLILSACSSAPPREGAQELSQRVAPVVAQAQDGTRNEAASNFIKAARDGDADGVRRFLVTGVKPDARNADGETALLAAASSMNAETVKMLVAAGADVNVASTENGWTPLMTAAFFGATESVRVLLDAGADVNATNQYGETALLQATFRGQDDVVKELLAHGADVAPHNDKGFTALRAARYKQFTGIVQALEDSGARE